MNSLHRVTARHVKLRMLSQSFIAVSQVRYREEPARHIVQARCQLELHGRQDMQRREPHTSTRAYSNSSFRFNSVSHSKLHRHVHRRQMRLRQAIKLYMFPRERGGLGEVYTRLHDFLISTAVRDEAPRNALPCRASVLLFTRW